MAEFHHHKLPKHSALLMGRVPQDKTGFQSQHLQIWYNNEVKSWVGNGETVHMHQNSDECFIVLKGALIVTVGGKRYTIGPREFCCFPQGIFHGIVEVKTPVETFMIRAPSVDDKVYKDLPKTKDLPK
jgi:mannose-6-phosphate isomerase-like protein (cupin superfamily)